MSQLRAGTLCKGTDSSRLCKPSVSKAVWLEIQALGSAQCRHSLGEHLQMELQEQGPSSSSSSSIPCLQSPV